MVLSAMLGVTDKLVAAGEAAAAKQVDKAWKLRREVNVYLYLSTNYFQ